MTKNQIQEWDKRHNKDVFLVVSFVMMFVGLFLWRNYILLVGGLFIFLFIVCMNLSRQGADQDGD